MNQTLFNIIAALILVMALPYILPLIGFLIVACWGFLVLGAVGTCIWMFVTKCGGG